MVWYLHWLQMWEHLEELNFQLKSDPKQGSFEPNRLKSLNSTFVQWFDTTSNLQQLKSLNGPQN
jgi:hypothetical protein